MIIMQGNSGEFDIECGDTEMQVVEQGNSEGGWEDGGGEDENNIMTSYDQRSDMNTGEKHGDKDSEISEDVENGGNEQENVEGEKPRKVQEQKSDIRGGANMAGSSINPIVVDDDSDVFVGFFQLFSILSLILPQIAQSGVSLEHQTKVKVLYLVSARNIQRISFISQKYNSDQPVFAYGPNREKFPITFTLHVSKGDIFVPFLTNLISKVSE